MRRSFYIKYINIIRNESIREWRSYMLGEWRKSAIIRFPYGFCVVLPLKINYSQHFWIRIWRHYWGRVSRSNITFAVCSIFCLSSLCFLCFVFIRRFYHYSPSSSRAFITADYGCANRLSATPIFRLFTIIYVTVSIHIPCADVGWDEEYIGFTHVHTCVCVFLTRLSVQLICSKVSYNTSSDQKSHTNWLWGGL